VEHGGQKMKEAVNMGMGTVALVSALVATVNFSQLQNPLEREGVGITTLAEWQYCPLLHATDSVATTHDSALLQPTTARRLWRWSTRFWRRSQACSTW